MIDIGVEMVLDLRIVYNVLIVTILLICIWFFHVSIKDDSYYRQIFKYFIYITIMMYLNRIFEISMDEGYIQGNDNLYTLERMIHFVLTLLFYLFYSYFMLCLIHQFNSYARWKRVLFFLPNIMTVFLVILSPLTHFVFYIEDGVYYEGLGVWIVVLIRAVYGLGATLYAFAKRRLLPKIFGQASVIVAVLAIVQSIQYFVTRDETLYYYTLVVNVFIFTLTTTVVEFYKDSLTGLLNREAFEQYAETEIGKRGNKAVYLIKLKNYEYIKNNWHETALLGIIVDLAICLREIAKLPSIYYLGVGRYVVIVHKRDRFHEKDFFEKLNERVDTTFELGGVSIHLNLFIAVMNMEKGKITKNNFYKYFTACDDMKYRSAKPLEIVHGDSLGIDQLQRYCNIEDAIERALIEKEFKMFYQPIYSTEKKKIISAEALIRLNDRVLGYVSPEEFIPIAENNGKIIEISEYVIDNVFRFVKETRLKDMGVEFIELNLSVMQCMDKKLIEKLQYYLDKYEVDPKQINLEITETATNFDEERLREQLAGIKKLGFHFSLDDYGTGYSNLVRVLEYPVDIIKLDKSIVWSAFHDKDNFITLKNLISMFHDVRRKIVAEGVETEEQMDTLVELGCDYLQGYYYSKPVSEEEFLAFVARYNVL